MSDPAHTAWIGCTNHPVIAATHILKAAVGQKQADGRYVKDVPLCTPCAERIEKIGRPVKALQRAENNAVRGETFTSLVCPLCDWVSIEVRDIFRTQLTPDYQAHYHREHMVGPIIRQREVHPTVANVRCPRCGAYTSKATEAEALADCHERDYTAEDAEAKRRAGERRDSEVRWVR